jgi:HAD superfamily hydrolase (TIGR01490 family)
MNLAIFDLDNTLIEGDSDAEWPRFLIKRGLLPQEHRQQSEVFYQQYLEGTLDIAVALDFQLRHLGAFSRPQLDALHAEYMEEFIRPIIPQKARDLLAAHHAQGDLVMIITATNRFITAPIARELGVEHLIAIELEQDAAGNFTGRPEGIPSFRDGKITRLEIWLRERDLTLASFDQTFFYSDSHNDLPLLSLVNHPVAVDPDATLRAHAQAHGWPVISLRS